jgi:cytochrome c oxidase cbb3-type subunit I/II
MPPYPWLLRQTLDTAVLPARIRALRRTGVPYPEGYEAKALDELKAQQARVVQNLRVGMVEAAPDREIIALIAYLQRLGTDIKNSPASTAPKLAAN